MPTKLLLDNTLLAYWRPKDPKWMAERQAKWLRIFNYENSYEGDSWSKKKKLLKQYQDYFFKGKLTIDEDDELSINLVLQLAWHPSCDPAVWQYQTALQLPYWDPQETYYTYEYLKGISDYVSSYTDLTTADPSELNGREPQLFKFFYCEPGFPQFIQYFENKNSSVFKRNGIYAHHSLYATFALPLVVVGGRYFNALHQQLLPYLAEFLTDEAFDCDLYFRKKQCIAPTELETILTRRKEILVSALRVLDGEMPVENALKDIIASWYQQYLLGSEKWQALLTEVKKQRSNKIVSSLQVTDQPVDNLAEQVETTETVPWPENFVALKQAFAEHGYNLPDGTSAHLDEILSTLFPQQRILFGLFTDAAYSADDLTEPFATFTYPLNRLCELSGSHQLNYQQKGDYLYLKADGNQVGKIYLDDPMDEGRGNDGVANYFKQVVKLAQQWFPGQVYCYGEDEFVVYVLPADVVAVLAQQGFASKPDYFGA